MYLYRFRLRAIQYPSIQEPCVAVADSADRHSAIESAESVRAIERDVAPLCVEAVDPVEASEGVGEADGEDVEASGIGGVGEVALEGQLLHDGVADELAVEVDLGAKARSTDVEEDALALHFRRDGDFAMPPRDAE